MGRTVVVTGAASGIGLGIADAFRELGDAVHLIDISRARLERATSEWTSGAEFFLHEADVADFGRLDELVEGIGSVDVFVNSAGVFDGYADILETSPELWARVIGINLTGTFNGCKVAAARMIPNGRGRIINVGSVAVERGAADGLSYAASKAGIAGMTRRLAVDVGPHGVTANVICPGTIGTGIRENSEEILGTMIDMNRGVSAKFTQELRDFLIPAHRAGTVAEIASLAVYLASDGAAYINGQTIFADGGWTAA